MPEDPRSERADAAGEARDLRLRPEDAGRRLDRALADLFPDRSRTQVAGWILEGRVLLDGERADPARRVRGGELVRVRVPPPARPGAAPEAIPLAVLHRDEAVLVLDKPAGLTVHPGAGRRGGTLANALAHHLGALPLLHGAERPGIVHRLDRDTSGVMVVALTEAAQRALSDAFARRRVRKEYLALVHGVPPGEEGVVDLPVGRSPLRRTKMTVLPAGGRPAVTGWRVERRLRRHTLLRCFPRTGRTHQIRVHCLALRHPIYGWRSAAGDALAGRLMLHAHRLAFPHPATGAVLLVEAAPPPAFLEAVERLAGLE
jgi:23S rRNA pseudouridine1911/1915/1917 synthase